MLNLIPDTKVDLVEKCSGHGGSWGVKKGNFEVALKIGKSPTKALLSKNNEYISSTCPLALEHINQISEKEKKSDFNKNNSLLHPLEILAISYGLVNCDKGE